MNIELPRHDHRVNLLGLDQLGMRAFVADLNEKPYRATQLLQWVHQQGYVDFSAMTNLGKDLRTRLGEIAVVSSPEIVRDQVAADGTRKWLLKLHDGNCIETVFIPEEDRGTLCISSQVGCALNCTFCSTGYQGFNRNLTTAEIVSQLWLAKRLLSRSGFEGRIITNVVMMGMGEPLLNFENVIPAMRLMQDDLAYGLSRRRITLSTAGVVPAIDRLREECHVSLAVSLHAANDALRNELVPLNKKYPIGELLAACKRYVSGIPRQKITFEYVMLTGVNDSQEHARELVARLRGVPSKVNLIPFNPFPCTKYRRSSDIVIDGFREVLLKAGIMAVTRKIRGDDIDAACGQLAGRFFDRTRRNWKISNGSL